MNNLFVLISDEPETPDELIGVFSSRENADRARSLFNERFPHTELVIEEMEWDSFFNFGTLNDEFEVA